MNVIISIGHLLSVVSGEYTLTGLRGGDHTVLAHSGTYNYVPSLMYDGKWRVWWCSGLAGDFIWYSESSSLDAGWTAPQHVFGPNTAAHGSFDDQHTCDPSVVRVGSQMYLFYGGLRKADERRGRETAIGVAVSTDDGHTWARLNGGKPIVEPAMVRTTNKYGAGQPSVVHLDGYFYMVYTDTSGAHSPGTGNCAYAMRSPQATFGIADGTQVLSDNGWEPLSTDLAARTKHHLVCCASVDWVYSDILDSFLLGCDGYNATATRVKMYPRNLSATLDYVDVPGSWTEGPGLAHRPDGHALLSSAVSKVPVDIMRSVGPGGPNTWTLAHDGADVHDTTPVSDAELAARFVRAAEGYILRAADMPMTIVVEGLRLQFDSGKPVQHLSRNSITVSKEWFDKVPYGGGMHRGVEVIAAPGKPAAFVLDGKKWPTNCIDLIVANGSKVKTVSEEEYNSHPNGPALRCIGGPGGAVFV